jgi:acetyl-CoA carboxylase biotin carboxyl carrier protein
MAKKPAAQTTKKAIHKPSAIDTDLIRSIAHLLTETNVGEIEVAKGDLKVRVSRFGSASSAPVFAAPVPAPQPVVAAAAAPLAPVGSSSAEASKNPGAVKSPMVGTAYRKPSPDTKNFVEVGSVVKAGDKLMLIEAMKTFNDIVAPRAGKVTAIFVEDGNPVEFDQTLFVIE